MLCIAAKVGTSIKVGDDITIHVKETVPGKVRLCFDAPRSVEIQRSDAKHKAPREAVAP